MNPFQADEVLPVHSPFNLLVRNSRGNGPADWLRQFEENYSPASYALVTYYEDEGGNPGLFNGIASPDRVSTLKVTNDEWGYGVIPNVFNEFGGNNDHPWLIVSPSVEILPEHVQLAYEKLNQGYDGVSFYVPEHGNDGSGPGKMGYNTVMFWSARAARIIGGIEPELVRLCENGGAGTKTYTGEDGSSLEIPFGGGEETIYVCKVASVIPQVKFAHCVSLPVSMKTKGRATGTYFEVGFDAKLWRKVPSALAYLDKLRVSVKKFMSHWDLV